MNEGVHLVACQLDDFARVTHTEAHLRGAAEDLPQAGHAQYDVPIGLEAGQRVALGEKRNPTDFALWKFSPPGEQRLVVQDLSFGLEAGQALGPCWRFAGAGSPGR